MSVLIEGWIVLELACAQAERLPGVPVTMIEIMDEMQPPPADPAQREAAMLALIKQTGARDGDIRILPLAEAKVRERVDLQKEKASKRMVEAGASPAEIEAGLKVFDAPLERLGNNLMIVLPGRTQRVIGFGAHYDAAAGSEGVLDAWASCVLLTELYQTLRTVRMQHTLWFVFFAEAERGCLGSTAWAGGLTQKEIQRIDAFVTLECAGVAPPMAWWSGSSSGTVEIAAEVAKQAGFSLPVVDFAGVSSDGLSLKERKIPTLSLLGVDAAHLHLLHGPGDRFDALDRARIDESFRLLRVLADDFDRHAQPLLWDYAKAKLRINDAATGRKPIRPAMLDLTAVSLAAPSVTAPPPVTPDPAPPAPDPTPSPEAKEPPRDGSQP